MSKHGRLIRTAIHLMVAEVASDVSLHLENTLTHTIYSQTGKLIASIM